MRAAFATDASVVPSTITVPLLLEARAKPVKRARSVYVFALVSVVVHLVALLVWQFSQPSKVEVLKKKPTVLPIKSYLYQPPPLIVPVSELPKNNVQPQLPVEKKAPVLKQKNEEIKPKVQQKLEREKQDQEPPQLPREVQPQSSQNNAQNKKASPIVRRPVNVQRSLGRLRSQIAQQVLQSESRQAAQSYSAKRSLSIMDAAPEVVETPEFELVDPEEIKPVEVDCNNNMAKGLQIVSGLFGGSMKCQQVNGAQNAINKRLSRLKPVNDGK